MFDLEKRTLKFTVDVRQYLKEKPVGNFYSSDFSQVMRSSAAIGANYLEANDSLGKKDFLMRLRIARKEAKETVYWLKVLNTQFDGDDKLGILIREAIELKNILSAIIQKSDNRK